MMRFDSSKSALSGIELSELLSHGRSIRFAGVKANFIEAHRQYLLHYKPSFRYILGAFLMAVPKAIPSIAIVNWYSYFIAFEIGLSALIIKYHRLANCEVGAEEPIDLTVLSGNA
jgi:hypothetical protein